MNRIEIYDDNSVLTFKILGREGKHKIVTGHSIIRYIEEFSSMRAKSYKEHRIKDYETDVMLDYDDANVVLRNIEKLAENGLAEHLTIFDKEAERLENLERTKRLKAINKEKLKVERENKHSSQKINFIKPIALSLALGITLSTALMLSKNKSGSKTQDIPTYTYNDTEKDFALGSDLDVTNTITDNSYIDNSTFLTDTGKEEDVSIMVDVSQIGDRTETDKAQYTRDTYGNIIEKYSNMYGLDPELMIAIATQERGTHSSKKDSDGATGLMQLQNSVWVGKTIKAYNHDTGKNESFVVTENMLGDLETNVKIGCMYFQDCLKKFNFNPLLAVQCYNFGYGNLNKVLNAYSNDSGKSKQEIIEDPYDTGWMDYRSVVKNQGDKKYIEHVFSYLEESKISIGNSETKLDFSFDFGYDNNDNVKTH